MSDAAAATVGAALREARALGLPRLDAQLLLAHALARPRPWLLANDDAGLDAERLAEWRALRDRRLAGEPLAYLVGTKEFHGLQLHVDARVLVPRPETEGLVDWALEHLGGATAGARVVDLGTGSGAIALAVKHACPGAQVIATDADAGALAVARANGARLGVDVDWRLGDWWSALAAGESVDLALSNPPYVAGDDAHLAALGHEPRHALTPGGDGLDALRRIVAGAAGHVRPGGWLLLEHGHDQADAVRALLAEHGFAAIETRRDLAGHARCTGGCRAGARPA
ncbi:MAG TPA: peptide chain release factor N(5)-glutamine methyltransferase [Burkholderiaceae bacterium]|nr:peptide chain release factor N(5)-glutamine methyltransferase [Burkholderiaceae bacterium]